MRPPPREEGRIISHVLHVIVTVTRYAVDINQQEAQLMLTNPGNAFRGQSRSENMVSFEMLRLVSYL